MTREEARIKIRKLLALAKSPNEHEAAVALQKAKQLLEAHDLTVEDVMRLSLKDFTEQEVYASQRVPKWISCLAGAIASIFDVVAVYQGKLNQRAIVFTGLEVDVEISVHCFHFLRRAIEEGARKQRAYYKESYGYVPTGFKNSYAFGFIRAVEGKLSALSRKVQRASREAEVKGDPRFPVVKKRLIEQYKARMGERKMAPPEIAADVYTRGVKDGSRQAVMPPVAH